MKKYIGTKQIEAEPMMKDGKKGYKVQYPDGYVSWSPKDAFEEAYSEIGENPLHDTALLMKSVDFKDRFRAEYRQLENRVYGLRAMLEKYKAGTLSFKPLCSYELLHEQLVHMESYARLLDERAKTEGIELTVESEEK